MTVHTPIAFDETGQFDREVDVIVLGAGAAGMTTAIVASNEGLDVLVVEKTGFVGGSAAYSAGVAWIPDNDHVGEVGMTDTLDAARTYLNEVIGNAQEPVKVSKYLETGAEAFRYLEANSEVAFAPRGYTPDYWSERAGASNGGRALGPVEFDGRKLGSHFDEVRPPPVEVTVLGGMMISAVDAGHLLNRFKSLASLGHVARIVLRHLRDRLVYKRGTRLVMGNALVAQLYKSLLDRNVPVWLNAPVGRLLSNVDGGIVGVEVRRDGRVLRIAARRGVVIATGGYPANQTMRDNLMSKGNTCFSAAPPVGTGDGIRLGLDVGATMGRRPNTEAYWSPVSRSVRDDGSVYYFPHLVMDRSKPGVIAVNLAGRRFVNEAYNYHDFARRMLDQPMREDGARAFLICDHRFITRYTLGLSYPGRSVRERMIRKGYLFRGRSVEDLAAQLGIQPGGLVGTLDHYNASARRGEDPLFSKGGTEYNRYLGDPSNKPNPCIAPIEQGPFYGMPLYVGDIGTCFGLETDEFGRVLNDLQAPIPGLFACGNDMNSVMKGEYPAAGITLGPALTFGYIVGRFIASGKHAASGQHPYFEVATSPELGPVDPVRAVTGARDVVSTSTLQG